MKHSPKTKEFLGKQISRISKFSSKKDAVCRLAYSKEEQAAFEYVKRLMGSAGLATSYDKAGNLFGKLGQSDEKMILVGSHLDSVHMAGKYDGVAGVLSGIDALRQIRESNKQLRHDIAAVAWRGEESARFGLTYIGSRCAFGSFTDAHALRSDSDITIADAMQELGYVHDAASLGKSNVAAYLELHIEQGPILERTGNSIGIVNGIAGNVRFRIDLTGVPDHTGTSRMDDRKDASIAMARIISKAWDIVNQVNDQKRVEKGEDVRLCSSIIEQKNPSLTTVPSDISITFDVRSIDAKALSRTIDEVKNMAVSVASDLGVKIGFNPIMDEQPLEMTHFIAEQEAVCCDLGISHIVMPSGAGHDAKIPLSEGIPTGMIFVPSIGGISHNPAEFTSLDDLDAGTRVLAETIIRVDQKI
jgi:hydantoinase/carbamoylase family amidase